MTETIPAPSTPEHLDEFIFDVSELLGYALDGKTAALRPYHGRSTLAFLTVALTTAIVRSVRGG